MSFRHHIDDFMRGRIIGKIEEERKITDVAREFDIAHSIVSRLWKSFKTTGMCSRRHGEVVLEFLAASGKQISRKTVARRLRGGGLYAPRPVVCVPLTRQHRTANLQWCREHHNWTEQDWACALLLDESRFSLSSDCRRQLIWRESDTAYRPENIQGKDRYPTCSIIVWAGIMINGRTRLHVVANGTMMGQRYMDEVLLPHVRLFRGAVGDKFVFMDDNATCHRTLAVQDCLDSESIQRLVWPSRFPDLNPIENVWDAMGRQVAGRNYPPTNNNTLIRALTEEWDKLLQQLLDNVVQNDEALCEINFTDDFLIQFLRYAKYNIQKAFSHLKNFIRFKKKYDFLMESVPENYFSEIPSSRFATILPSRCPDGCTIIYCQIGLWDPSELLFDDFRRLILMLFIQALCDPMTQINGFKIIYDFDGTSWKHMRFCTPRLAHFQYHFALECIPIRYKEVHLVNDSLILSAFWTLIKNFLSAKVKSRILFHSNGETLLNHFPRSVLPAKYGGDLTDWFQEDLVKRLNKEYGSCPLGGQNNFY
ncbi:alpha-tocopherol transfer protein [Trichonephila clavipes]|nr:alpha-tocopherol transfer protein [Trichonephila clavipes]